MLMVRLVVVVVVARRQLRWVLSKCRSAFRRARGIKYFDLARDSYTDPQKKKDKNRPSAPFCRPCHLLFSSLFFLCHPPSSNTMPAKNTKAPAAVASKQGPADENVFLFIPNLIGTLMKQKGSNPNCRHHPYNSTYLGSRTSQMRRGWKRIAGYVVVMTITQLTACLNISFSCLSTTTGIVYRIQPNPPCCRRLILHALSPKDMHGHVLCFVSFGRC